MSDNNIKVSIAFGYAFYDISKDKDYNDVFNRADEIMYENERKFKLSANNS